jgi:regulatory protein
MAFAIIKRGSSEGGYYAVPYEGSSFFMTTKQLKFLKLKENSELTKEEFYKLREEVVGYRCQQKALDALTRREHSYNELRLKLSKNFPPDIIERNLKNLVDKNLLNDKRFAQQFVISRQKRNPEGPYILIQRLLQKGIERSLAQEVVDTYFEEDQNREKDLEVAYQKLVRRKKGDIAKIEIELRKKGFSYSEVKEFLKS